MGHDLNLNKKGQKGKKGPFFPFFCLRVGEERKRRAKIYGVLSVKVCQAKNESSLHRQGLRVGIENAGLCQGSKRGVREIKGFGFRKC